MQSSHNEIRISSYLNENVQIEKRHERIIERILKIALEIAKEGEGALFVIDSDVKYKRLLKQRFKPFSIFEKGSGRLLKSLAVIDGAIIIDGKGIVKDYGAMVIANKTFTGYGTRHSAGLSASKGGISILASEEDRNVKIFKDEKIIMQLNSLKEHIEESVPLATKILESLGFGAIGAIGTSLIIPAIALPQGIIIFGGSYYALKNLLPNLIKKMKG